MNRKQVELGCGGRNIGLGLSLSVQAYCDRTREEADHGYIDVFAYSDGHIELRADGTSLERVRFDERPFVDAGAIIENKRLGHAFEGGAAHSGAA